VILNVHLVLQASTEHKVHAVGDTSDMVETEAGVICRLSSQLQHEQMRRSAVERQLKLVEVSNPAPD